jgi:DNA-binding transcriptional MerR regulator
MDEVMSGSTDELDAAVHAAEVPAEAGFTGRRTAEIVGISYRQLDYWARTGLVTPSLAEARGSGSRRSYSYRDLLELKVIKTLLDAGLKLESVRKVFDYMREHLGEDITSANLVISGTTSVLVRSGEELIDVLQQGQGVLNVLPLAGVKEEIDARIVEFRPAGTAEDAPVVAAPVGPAAAGL